MQVSPIEDALDITSWQYWESTPLAARKLFARPAQDCLSCEPIAPVADVEEQVPIVCEVG